MERIGEHGTLDCSELVEFAHAKSGLTLFQDGDVIIAKITPCFENGKGALCQGLPGGHGFGTTELHVLRPNLPLTSRFLYYVTASSDFRLAGIGAMSGAAGQKRVSDNFVRDFLCPVPCVAAQTAICDFLDRETERNDALIEKKERLIALLEEKRAALINCAVTKGLDPVIPMKDSGIAAIPLVPDHWNVLRNKVLFREIDDRSMSGTEELLSVSHITGVTPRAEKDVSMFMAESMEGYKRCRSGDLVINTMWAYMGALGVSRREGIVSPSYNVYRVRSGIGLLPEYFDLLCRTRAYVCEITRESKGIWFSRLRLYPDSFLNLRTPLPPVSEQEAIVRSLQDQSSTLDALIARLRTSIGKFQEYRTALISAAVTGKIDVRGAAEV